MADISDGNSSRIQQEEPNLISANQDINITSKDHLSASVSNNKDGKKSSISDSDTTASRNHKSRSSNRQSAKRILEKNRLCEENGIELSDEFKKSLDWAVKFQQEDNLYKASLAISESSKRDRSLEESFGLAKRYKSESNSRQIITNLDGLSLRDIVKMNLKVSIVDTSSPDWRISVENFTLIENHIMKRIVDLITIKNVDPPNYDMSERFHGFRIISCETQFALDFLTDCMKELVSPWEGAIIELKSLKDLPAPQKIRIVVPELYVDNATMIKVLSSMNKDIPIETWRLIRTGEIRNGRKVVTFRADDQSINLLKEKGNKLYYSIRKIPVFVSKTRSLEMEQEEGEKSDMDNDEFLKRVDGLLDITPALCDVSLEDNNKTLTN